MKGVQTFCFCSLNMQNLWRCRCRRVVDLKLPIMKLKQTRRQRKRESHLKMSLRVSAIIFQLFKVSMPEKCALTILELNWNQRLGQDKIEHLSSYAHVVHTTAKKVIHVIERTRTSSKCQKMKFARAKRAKILFLIVKYANL